MVSETEKMFLVKHLATLIHAGVALPDALDTIREQSKGHMKNVLITVSKDVQGGDSLSDSMAKHKEVFNQFWVSLTAAGEASGTLDENLGFLAEQMEKDYSLKKKVKGALMYPTFVTVLAVVMGLGVSYYVLPKLLDLFSSFETALPLPTVILMTLAYFMRDYGLWVIIGLVLFLVLGFLSLQVSAIRMFVDRWIVKVPIAGQMIVSSQMARVSRNMGILIKSGLPIMDVIKITGDTLDNVFYKKILAEASVSVSKGKPLGQSLMDRGKGNIPGIVFKMIEVGEKSGNLSNMLMYLSEYYDEEIEGLSKSLTTMLEPVLLVTIGLIVGFLAMAVISPIYSLVGSF